MNKLSKYTGLHYNFRLYNCWHHVRRVRADNKLQTPDFDCSSPDDADAVFDAAHNNTKGMVQITEPEPFCAVLIATERRNRIVWHSGVYLDGMVSHCDMVARQVRLDSLKSLQEKSVRIEFWR